MHDLDRGDLVRLKGHGEAFNVEANCGGYVVVIKAKLLTNPNEWDLVSKADRKRSTEILRCKARALNITIEELKKLLPQLDLLVDRPSKPVAIAAQRDLSALIKKLRKGGFHD